MAESLTTSPHAVAPAATGGARPLRRDAELNRQRIIVAAQEVFASRGLGVGLNDIAHHAGVAVGTVYRRFPDKNLLIEAALQERVQALIEALRVAASAPSAWDGLVHVFEAMTAFNAADRGLRDALFGAEQPHAGDDQNEGGGQGAGRPAVFQRLRETVDPLMQDLVDRAHTEGSLRPDVGLSDILLSHLLISEFAHHCTEGRPMAYRRMTTLVLDGLRARDVTTNVTRARDVTSNTTLSQARGSAPGNTQLTEPELSSEETAVIARTWLTSRH